MNWKPAQLLLLIGILAVSAGCVSQPASGPLAQAEVSLKEARQARSNPQIATGDYLDAADAALRANGSRSTGEDPDQARLTYNTACQELALLLQSNRDFWDRTSTVRSSHHIYHLHFSAGSHQAETWDPAYLDFYVHPKSCARRAPTKRYRGAVGAEF